MKLGVNIDHVATLRQAREVTYPDPVVGALLAEYAGADSIVAHLREDRRHIKERDIILIRQILKIPFNLEMSINKDIVHFACDLIPHHATLVPEKRKELTTEGGIDLKKHHQRVGKAVEKLKSKNISVSLFIDPLKMQVDLAAAIGADAVELNTGKFSESRNARELLVRSKEVARAARYASDRGFFVAAGHGLDYENVKHITAIRQIQELNIGHSIISRAVFTGLVNAVEEMRVLLEGK